MQYVLSGYQGLGLLFEINNDRLISALIVGAAMAAVGWVGVEYVHSSIAQDQVLISPTFL